MRREIDNRDDSQEPVESYSGQHEEEENAREAVRLAQQYNKNNTIPLDTSKFNR